MKAKEIISKEELASKFALALKAAVQECSDRIYPLYEQEYKFLKQKYPDTEDYNRELKKYYDMKIAFREKHVGPFAFNVEKYLTSKILSIGLRSFGDEGGTYFEHDKIRQLLDLYSKSLDVKYKYRYQPANDSFGKVEVVAYAKGSDRLKEISFEFEYLSDTLKEAAELIATIKLIDRIGVKLKKQNTTAKAEQTEKGQSAKGSNPNAPEHFKLKWNGDRMELINVFRTMAGEKHPKLGILLSNVGVGQIVHLVTYNFDIPREGFMRSRKSGVPGKLLYCGDRSALVMFFYYLTIYKGENKKPYIETDGNTKKALTNFLHTNFLIGDKDCKNYTPLLVSTIVSCLDDCQKFGKTADGFMEYIETHKLRNNSLINFLKKNLR